MSSFKRVVNVIPLTRVSLDSSQIFTYLVPLKLQDQLRPGQLVRIPFGKRKLLGVTSSFEMHRLKKDVKGFKQLAELLEAIPVLTERNLALANWMANYYVSSLGLTVKAMLPKVIAKAKKPELVGYEPYNPDFVLTEHQRRAVNQIGNSLGQHKLFMLHGVTGSGKTEVYMQVMQRVIEAGQQAIILVPEISLTPQAVERFARRFGIDKIALLHSRLRDSERAWVWQRIRDQKKQVIIGPRSAVFSPVQQLGLIVIDEEHDPSYKQYDQNPKYRARQVAKKLGQLWSCPVVLGDATPSVESYYEASGTKSILLHLPNRIKADITLPPVKIVDMRKELQAGNKTIFSQVLQLAILGALKAKHQIILFLNRRGAARFVMCRDCGAILECRNCSTTLVWHSAGEKLLCHHCGQKAPIPTTCPNCRSYRIKHFGTGTQKVEEELNKFLKKNLPKEDLPRIQRLDSDTVTNPKNADQVYRDWVNGKIQILIGTQIISKSWDVRNVALVGIISADSTLHLPDFRSNERTFQLLTQVAGRAGRGKVPGEVVLQTYQPDNYAIQATKLHDYEMFFQREIRHRKEYQYPPFSRLVKLTVRHRSETKAYEQARAVAKELLAKRDFAMEILGPLPAFFRKLRSLYQYQIFLRFSATLDASLYSLLQDLPGSVDIDVDPISLL